MFSQLWKTCLRITGTRTFLSPSLCWCLVLKAFTQAGKRRFPTAKYVRLLVTSTVFDSEEPLPTLTTENGFSGSSHVVWSEVQNYVLTAFKWQRLLLNKWTRNLFDIKKNPIYCFQIKILIISKGRKKSLVLGSFPLSFSKCVVQSACLC